MARTLSEIRTDVRQIIGQPDSNNSNFTNSQLDVFINEGYRNLAVALRTLPVTTRDYTAASGDIDLNTSVITVDSARVYDSSTEKFYNLEVITIDRMVLIDPDFENATAGKPRYFVRTGTFTAQLYPPPDADVNGETLRLIGLENPTELSDDSDTPDLPGNMHDVIPAWAAQRCLFALERGEEAVAQLTLYRSMLKEMKQTSTEFSRTRRRMMWDPGDNDLA